MGKKLLILAGVIVVIAVVIGIAVSGGALNKVNGEYDYSLQATTSFNYSIGSYQYTCTADEGNQFVIATIILKNVDYDGGLSTNPLYFNLKSNGVTYSYDLSTFNYPGYKDLVTLDEGTSRTFVVLYQVPISETAGSIVWNGFAPNVEFNDSLM